MPWSANIDTIEKNGSSATIQVTYNNEASIIRESYNFDSPHLLKTTIKNKLKQLQIVDDFVSSALPGPVVIDPDVIVTPPTIDPEVAKRDNFIENLKTLKAMKNLISLEIKTLLDQDYIDQKTLVISKYKPSYLPFLNFLN